MMHLKKLSSNKTKAVDSSSPLVLVFIFGGVFFLNIHILHEVVVRWKAKWGKMTPKPMKNEGFKF